MTNSTHRVPLNLLKQLDFNGQRVMNISICHHCDAFDERRFYWRAVVMFEIIELCSLFFEYLSLEYSHLSALKLRTSNCYMSPSPSLSN